MSDTDADLTALIADARAWANSRIGSEDVKTALRLVDAVERLTRERDDARAEVEQVVTARNYAMRQRDEERKAKEGNIRHLNAAIERTEATEAEAADLRTRLDEAEVRLANVRALADEWDADWREDLNVVELHAELRRALDGPQDGGDGRCPCSPAEGCEGWESRRCAMDGGDAR